MDGYIKEQKEKIKNERKTLFLKMLITLPILLAVIVSAIAILAETPPERWKEKDIIPTSFSDGSGMRLASLLYTADNECFRVDHSNRPKGFESKIKFNEKYHIVYVGIGFGRYSIKALYNDEHTLISLEDSLNVRNRHIWSYGIAIKILVPVFNISAIAAYQLLCKKQRLNIKKYRSNIEKRLSKTSHR